METTQNRYKNLLQSAKTRMTSQKEQLEKMTAEMNEQKKLLESMDKAKSKWMDPGYSSVNLIIKISLALNVGAEFKASLGIKEACKHTLCC